MPAERRSSSSLEQYAKEIHLAVESAVWTLRKNSAHPKITIPDNWNQPYAQLEKQVIDLRANNELQKQVGKAILQIHFATRRAGPDADLSTARSYLAMAHTYLAKAHSYLLTAMAFPLRRRANAQQMKNRGSIERLNVKQVEPVGMKLRKYPMQMMRPLPRDLQMKINNFRKLREQEFQRLNVKQVEPVGMKLRKYPMQMIRPLPRDLQMKINNFRKLREQEFRKLRQQAAERSPNSTAEYSGTTTTEGFEILKSTTVGQPCDGRTMMIQKFQQMQLE